MSHLPLSLMNRLSQTESAVFKLWMPYFQMISFRLFKLKLLQRTGLKLWSMDLFLTVTEKDKYFQERLIINDIFEDFPERFGRLTLK